MNLKKQLALTFIIIALGAAMIGAGTFAYFSDTVESAGNTFEAGSIKLAIGGLDSQQVAFNFANQKPGDTRTVSLTVNNNGTLDANLMVKASYAITADNGDNSDLGEVIRINSISWNGTNVNLSAYAGQDQILTLKELNEVLLSLGQVDAQAKDIPLVISMQFIETNSPQNQYQGDSISVKFDFELRQLGF